MTRNRPTTACLVNHYNYGAFVGDAIRGALAQTVAFDEILVVDDGSQPEHLARVRAACAGHERVTLIEKANGGQLSCFNVGFERSKSDIVFFLDADDFWDEDYVARALEVYQRRPDIAFVAAAARILHSDGTKREERLEDRDLGYSVVRCHRYPHWVGAPTSCLSMRRSTLAKFLPHEAGPAWRTCADECLVYGASLAGARKYQLGSVHVNYRVHGANAWHNKKPDAANVFQRRLEGLKLCEQMSRKLGYPAEMAELAALEFRTVQRPDHRDLRHYRKVVTSSGLGLWSKIGLLASLQGTYWFGRKQTQPRS